MLPVCAQLTRARELPVPWSIAQIREVSSSVDMAVVNMGGVFSDMVRVDSSALLFNVWRALSGAYSAGGGEEFEWRLCLLKMRGRSWC